MDWSTPLTNYGETLLALTHKLPLSRTLAGVVGVCWMGVLGTMSCSASDDGKPYGAATELIEARNKTICRKTFECCTANDIAINSAQSEAECLALDSGLYMIANSVNAGTVTVDWPLAQNCFVINQRRRDAA